MQKKNYGVKDFVDFKQSEVQEENVWLGFEQINSSQANDILRIPQAIMNWIEVLVEVWQRAVFRCLQV